MRIGIDASVLERNINSGVGRYLKFILETIPILDKNNEYVLFSNQILPYSNSFYNLVSTKQIVLNRLYSSLWLHFTLPKLLIKNKIDLLFGPNQILPLQKGKIKTVVVIHDVFNKVNKDYLPFLYRTKLNLELPIALKRSNKIISISENTKRDLMKYYDVDTNKIIIIQQAVDSRYGVLKLDKEEKNSISNKYNLPEKFILYVGGIEKRKNISGILKISDIIHQCKPDIKTVIIGKSAYGGDTLLKEIKRRKEHITYLPFVRDDDLVKIYNMAFVFLFPSYYEGFGMPPVEAMKCGLPVLTSNTSSFPEIIGDAGILFPPESHKLFIENIINLDSDPEFYSELKAKSLKRAEMFSVEKNTRELINVFNKIMQTKN
jgi:glycosyltransferase involved in cell wall biosynthesis